ncbi:hypothetical protein TL16_g07016 [Triparma laevis f. inornata]|uniref:ATP-dependent DNA helicase n=1 Tax=Triparma laevis f. inornata TaxID=1714386 RepID=A0A9W7EGX0_9STRA|nr:hypothetical protein TL16_g07016 [Triparma laevis f. inornata]
MDEFDKEVRQIRGNTEQCFGGIQLIFVGDFAQLGPVLKPANIDTPFKKADGFVESGLAFEGTMWTDANFEMVELKKSYRQPEPMFLNALNDIRMGFGDTSNVRWLVEKCSVRSGGAGGGGGDEVVKPTKLYPKNVDVNEINSAELAKLVDGEKHRYTAEDSAKPERGWKEEWLIGELEKNCMAPDVLDLKIGAEVMLIKNMPNEGLVNGSRGKVTEFRQDYGPHGVKAGDNAEYPVVKFGSGFGNSMNMLVKEMSFEMEILGKGTSTRKQIPLKLAWAVTIHKSQGLSIDLLEVEIESCFAKGQAYTALSRARTTNGLTILGKFDPDCVQCEDKVREFYGFPRKPEGGESTQTTTIPIPLLSPTAHDPTRTQSQPSAGTDAALGSVFFSSNTNISNQDEKIVKTPKTPMVKNPYL